MAPLLSKLKNASLQTYSKVATLFTEGELEHAILPRLGHNGTIPGLGRSAGGMPVGVQDPEDTIGKVSAFLADPKHRDASARFCIGAVRTFIDDPEHRDDSARFCLALAQLLVSDGAGGSETARAAAVRRADALEAQVEVQADMPAVIRGPPVSGMIRYKRRDSSDGGLASIRDDGEEREGEVQGQRPDADAVLFKAVSNDIPPAELFNSTKTAKNARDDRMTILGSSSAKRTDPTRKGRAVRKINPELEGPVLVSKSGRNDMDLDRQLPSTALVSGAASGAMGPVYSLSWIQHYRR
jgi:hypothetical protein